MLNETAKSWLLETWGTHNPIRLDSSVAWDIMHDAASGNQNAKAVWGEYANHKNLPEDPVIAAKQIQDYDKFLTKIYVDRLR